VSLEEAGIGFVEAQADADGKVEGLFQIAFPLRAIAEVAVKGGASEQC